MTRARTAALATLAGVAAALTLAAPASAHVTVAGDGATQGGYAVVTFRVPNEEASATTTKLQVQLPTDTPIASVSVQPVPGWTATATETTLAKPITTDDGPVTRAVSVITWTATGKGLAPGQFEQFPVSMGPLPAKPSIAFPALQTYSSGEVVKWIESAAPGSSEEPDHPAPTLQLAAAGATASSAPASSAAPSVSAVAQSSKADSTSGSSTGAVVLSIIALVVALLALGLAVVSRARRSTT